MTDTRVRTLENGTLVYVSGPMTGLPDFNRAAFNAETTRLRAQGLTVVNPAEFGEEPGMDWSDYMRKCICALADCDRIHLLPGWERSRGAMLELRIAHALGLVVTNARP